MKRRLAATAATAVLGVGVLAGCSSSSEPAADETTSQTDGGAEMLPPVIVEEGQTSVSAPVGKDIVINVPAEDIAGTTIASSDTAIVEVYQAKQEGDALYNPGAKGLAPGEATITVTKPDMTEYTIAVTITE